MPSKGREENLRNLHTYLHAGRFDQDVCRMICTNLWHAISHFWWGRWYTALRHRFWRCIWSSYTLPWRVSLTKTFWSVSAVDEWRQASSHWLEHDVSTGWQLDKAKEPDHNSCVCVIFCLKAVPFRGSMWPANGYGAVWAFGDTEELMWWRRSM